MFVTSTKKQILTARLLNKVTDIKIRILKAFSIFHHRLSKLIVKYKTGFKKTLLHQQQSILEQVFYGDLVDKLKGIVGKPNFSDPIKKIMKCY